jgi:hypothetical protein
MMQSPPTRTDKLARVGGLRIISPDFNRWLTTEPRSITPTWTKYNAAAIKDRANFNKKQRQQFKLPSLFLPTSSIAY